MRSHRSYLRRRAGEARGVARARLWDGRKGVLGHLANTLRGDLRFEVLVERLPEDQHASGFWNVLEVAIAAVRDDILDGRFEAESERDLQAMIYYHARRAAAQRGLPDNRVHADPPRVVRGVGYVYPDLVLGDNEAFLEIKFIRGGASGEQMKLKGWKDDAGKLGEYKRVWPSARCIFFAIDEAHHHSNPTHKDYFDPVKHGLQGDWRPFGNRGNLVLAESVVDPTRAEAGGSSFRNAQ